MIDTNIAFAVRCHACGRLNIHRLSLFDFSRTKRIELECTCRQQNAVLKTRDFKNFWMETLCFACHETHMFKYTLKQLLRGNIAARCVDTGMEMCFIGNNDDVELLIDSYEKESEDLINQLGFYDYFENSNIMMKSIEIVKKMDEEGKVICECGSEALEMNLYPDRIELKCLQCESIQMIYAENEEDLKNLQRKEKIIMHKHAFQCIDAINQNRDSQNPVR